MTWILSSAVVWPTCRRPEGRLRPGITSRVKSSTAWFAASGAATR